MANRHCLAVKCQLKQCKGKAALSTPSTSTTWVCAAATCNIKVTSKICMHEQSQLHSGLLPVHTNRRGSFGPGATFHMAHFQPLSSTTHDPNTNQTCIACQLSKTYPLDQSTKSSSIERITEPLHRKISSQSMVAANMTHCAYLRNPLQLL
jgi:hypothetical protein